MLGASWIGHRAVMPAIAASRNGRLVAIASRDPVAAREQASTHEVVRVHASYQDVLEDPEVDAVYIPLVNSLHREWTVRALEAGRHVLCEKPLAPTVADAEAMVEASRRHRRLLMEALMYRFHPRVWRLASSASHISFLQACFGFPLTDTETYRLRAELGGGALLDVGIYTIDVARLFLGEPESVVAVASGEEVDLAVTMALAFPSGAQAALWCSFESAKHEELVLVGREGTERLEKPFTSWRDPDDPYQNMVEAFAQAVLSGSEAPLSLESSLGNLRVVEAVRRALV